MKLLSYLNKSDASLKVARISIPASTGIDFRLGSIVSVVLLNTGLTMENEYPKIWLDNEVYYISIIPTYYAQNFGNDGDQYTIHRNPNKLAVNNYIANVYYI